VKKHVEVTAHGALVPAFTRVDDVKQFKLDEQWETEIRSQVNTMRTDPEFHIQALQLMKVFLEPDFQQAVTNIRAEAAAFQVPDLIAEGREV